MVGYLIRRVLQAIVVTALVLLITFLVVQLFPGGPVRALLGPRSSPAQLAYYNRLYGFNQPFYVQYGKWVWQLLHGNLGYSIKLNQSVSSLLATTLPETIVLVTLGLAVSLIFGIPLGIYQAMRRNTPGDHALTGVAFIGYATPTFLIGLLVITWFAVDVRLFPASAHDREPARAVGAHDRVRGPVHRGRVQLPGSGTRVLQRGAGRRRPHAAGVHGRGGRFDGTRQPAGRPRLRHPRPTDQETLLTRRPPTCPGRCRCWAGRSR